MNRSVSTVLSVVICLATANLSQACGTILPAGIDVQAKGDLVIVFPRNEAAGRSAVTGRLRGAGKDILSR